MADERNNGYNGPGADIPDQGEQLSFDTSAYTPYEGNSVQSGESYDDSVQMQEEIPDGGYFEDLNSQSDDTYQDYADQNGAEDLNMYATGAGEGSAPGFSDAYDEDYGGYNQGNAEGYSDDYDGEEVYYEEATPKKKRGFFGFGRKDKKKKNKKKLPDYDESDDSYYGVQLKPIDEYRKGYNAVTGEFAIGEDAYATLFDDSKKAIDNEVEKNFEQLRNERRSRVADAVQSAGMNKDELEDELGIVAPMPVSSFSADPYTRQHGVNVEGQRNQEDLPEFQRAQLEAINQEQTMEVKLNVANDTMEIQRVTPEDLEAPVSNETVDKILDDAPEAPEDNQETQNEEIPVQNINEQETVEFTPPVNEDVQQEATELNPDEEPYVTDEEMVQSSQDLEQTMQVSHDEIIEGRGTQNVPDGARVPHEYREKGIPTHVINADVLQSALLSETQQLEQAIGIEHEKKSGTRAKKREKSQPYDEYENAIPETQESIDDYTGPEDAKSISNELRGDMREMTMRMMISGVCTAILTVVNLIFGSNFASADDVGSGPTIYIVLTLIFAGVAIGVCYKTIIGGLKALFMFEANSDSGIAIAALGILVQTVTAIFFTQEVARGSLHLYAVVLTAMLFVNTAGKLTMVRRIHSNFRFVSSREQKYAVRNFDDHNTAIKMTKDAVAEDPAIAYQHPTGFLKRFLELSYCPDPAESASRTIAPIGLILSLVLCIACLLITGNMPSAISALAAALLASVAVGNMLAVNLPMSRLAKTARRAGAMVIGYEGVAEIGSSNAVMIDAGEIFPKGTVVLNGIKTYGSRETVQDTILAASALVNEVHGPLTGVFEQVITENEETLPDIENISYEDGNGIVGRVGGKKIYIGNRNLLINHRLEPPAREDETQYANGNRQVVYIAADAEVVAMMIVTYSADRRRKNELQRLEDNGVSIVVRTTDSNVTPVMLSKLFEVDVNSVVILDSELAKVSKKLAETEVPRSDALVATKGRVESMMNVVSLCINSLRQTNLIVALQTGAVILGFLLVAFLACFSAIKQLTSFALFMFELVALLIIIVIPRLRKP